MKTRLGPSVEMVQPERKKLKRNTYVADDFHLEVDKAVKYIDPK
jgi:hypothetical protein